VSFFASSASSAAKFKDIDENKPSGSIKIRVETIHYFLKRYIEVMNQPGRNEEVERQIAEYEKKLREQVAARAGVCRPRRGATRTRRNEAFPASDCARRGCQRGTTRQLPYRRIGPEVVAPEGVRNTRGATQADRYDDCN
jgi:hypothetical protein